MTKGLWSRAPVVFALFLAAPPVGAGSNGGVFGWVEDGRGVPISGAVVSLFGRGIGGGGLVTFTDSAGRFFLPSLPAGSYTVRALRSGHAPAPARKLVVRADQDATFTLSLAPLVEGAAARAVELQTESEDASREAKWLLRHKRRSVLEDRRADGTDPGADKPATSMLASWIPDLDGTLEVMTSPARMGVGSQESIDAASFSVVRLNGSISDSAHWSLGGMVAERQSTTWRMAAEFAMEPAEGHVIEAATGYGTRYVHPQGIGAATAADRSAGALSVQDRWTVSDDVVATLGGRFSYVGFLADTNHFDPHAVVEFQRDEQTRVHGTISWRTIAPGGDVLNLTGAASAPMASFAVMDGGLQRERVARYEAGVDQALGTTTVSAFTYYEDVQDQILNVFDGPRRAPMLRIVNGGAAASRGVGLSVARSFTPGVRASMRYTYGRSWRDAPGEVVTVAYRDADFHDLAARVETIIPSTDTRLMAFCRVNRLLPENGDTEMAATAATHTRFDVQLTQGLPFLGALTRADWDFLLAVRNLYYEEADGAALDETTVAHPPKRVLGGISVRF